MAVDIPPLRSCCHVCCLLLSFSHAIGLHVSRDINKEFSATTWNNDGLPTPSASTSTATYTSSHDVMKYAVPRHTTPADDVIGNGVNVTNRSRQRRTTEIHYHSVTGDSLGKPEVVWTRKMAGQTLKEIEEGIASARANCSDTSGLVQSLNIELPVRVLSRFSAETASAVHAANVISLLLQSPAEMTSHGDAFFFSFARAMVDSAGDWVNSATLIVDRPGHTTIGPRASRISRTTSVPDLYRVRVSDVGSAAWYTGLLQRSRGRLGKEGRCGTDSWATKDGQVVNKSTVISELTDMLWSGPYVQCPSHALTSLIVPIYVCDQQHNIIISGAVKLDIELDKITIDQCTNSADVFFNTHRCQPSTSCVAKSQAGFRRGNYVCQCATGYFMPASRSNRLFDGHNVELQYSLMLSGQPNKYGDLVCERCSPGCVSCDDVTPCNDVIITRVVLLGVQVFTMAVSIAVGVAIVQLRKTKVMKASFWVLLEIVVLGVLLVQSMVIVEYFPANEWRCLLVAWLREIGFIVVYGSLILKVYRVLAEFQSRKAQRILLRDRDILKYLLILIIIVVGYMITWTVVSLDHVTPDSQSHLFERRHVAGSNITLAYCTLGLWHYVIEIGECMFLCIGVYLCYCIRSAPSFYFENKFISFAIFNELLISTIYYVVRHCVWSLIEPTYVLLISFLRCQLTVTVTLLAVVGTKMWYVRRPPSDRACRRRGYSTSEPSVGDVGEPVKLSADSGVDVTDINLVDMNPDDIRAELKRLYTQLQVYKTKTMRRDNPHISKRRGGRKSGHRRFSLQAFHHKNRLQQSREHSISDVHDLEPASRTPEESTNSAEVVAPPPTLLEEPSSSDTCRTRKQ